MRLLVFQIPEPIVGAVLPEMTGIVGPEEACRRYRATVVTTLRQLRGLANARLRLLVDPGDADEAVRFWLLPRLADSWQQRDGVFQSSGWEIDFGGTHDGFHVQARGDIMCPWLGARWAHAAMLGLGSTASEVSGQASNGGPYFHAQSLKPHQNAESRLLPEVPVIRTVEDWDEALASALGAALKKAWEEEG